MFLRFFLLAVIFLFTSCTEVGKRDNPDDPDGINYGGASSTPSSSSSSGKGNDIANYKIVTIDDQVWMAENLDYYVSGSRCYNDNEALCAIYGRLYDWVTAMNLHPECNTSSCASQIKAKHQGICPEGWHIPSDADWGKLISYVGGDETAGWYLKATSGWSDGGSGEDKYGFSALPGGSNSVVSFSNIGLIGFWWSSSENGSYYAYNRSIHCDITSVLYNYYDKSGLQSVRCLQD